MRIAIFDHRIQIEQTVAHLPSDGRLVQVIEDRLIVLSNQNHHPLAMEPFRVADQCSKAARHIPFGRIRQSQALGIVTQKTVDTYIQRLAAVQQAISAKAFYGCDEAMVVTNSYYTKSAKELAGTAGVRLIDRDGLQNYLDDYNQKLIEAFQAEEESA